jgi:GTP-binding protein
VLLSKCDKLGRNEARATLKRVRAELGEAATTQLFSALSGEGLDEARRILKSMLVRSRGAATAGEPPLQSGERSA